MIMFALFQKRELVTYEARYAQRIIKGCTIVYSRSQKECIDKLRRCEERASGRAPDQIIIRARSAY